MSGDRSSVSDADPYRSPAEIAAEMPRAPRAPIPWKLVRAIVYAVALVAAPLVIGLMFDVGEHGTRWPHLLFGGIVLAGAVAFFSLVALAVDTGGIKP